MDVRYGFKGHMVKMLHSKTGTAILASCVPGGRTISTTASVAHILVPGVYLRIGSEEAVLKSISPDGKTLRVYPHLTFGAVAAPVYISETLIASAAIASTQNSLTLTVDAAAHVSAGDFIQIARVRTFNTTDMQVLTVSSVSYANSLVYINTIETISLGITTAGLVDCAVYIQKNVIVPSDSTESLMKAALEEMAAVGTVQVQRFGPSQYGEYTWSVSFTSVNGPTVCGMPITALSGDTCLQAFSSVSHAVSVTGCVAPWSLLVSTYVSDKYVNGRRQYRAINSPVLLEYDKIQGYIFKNINGTTLLAASTGVPDTDTPVGLTFPSSCSITASVASIVLNTVPVSAVKAGVSVAIVQRASAPSFTNTFSKLFSNKTQEVQNITLVASNGIVFGGFFLDFNASFVPVYCRGDETAQDMTYKLDSVPTVGHVSVSRTSLTRKSDGQFVGYTWLVTFLSAQGDLPMLTFDTTQLSSSSGNQLQFSITEAVKGVPLVLTSTSSPGDFIQGNQYSAQITANNVAGIGNSSLLSQNVGQGMMPLSFFVLGEPGKPNISSATMQTTSQVQLVITPPVDTGGAPIDRYVVEMTTSPAFFAGATYSFRISNIVSKDTHGVWRILFRNTFTEYLPFAADARTVQNALNSLPSVSGVVVSMQVSTSTSQGYEYTVLFLNDLGTHALGVISVDISRLTSEELQGSYTLDVLSSSYPKIPTDYSSIWMYNDCGKQNIGKKSEHQVITIAYKTASGFGSPTGSFAISVNGVQTACIPYSVSAASLRDFLVPLLNIKTDDAKKVVVEQHLRDDAFTGMSYIDYHVFFDGIFQELEWPILYIDPIYNGNNWGDILLSGCIAPLGTAPASASVSSITDSTACISGKAEVQTVIIESRTDLPTAGWFYLYLYGERSAAISANSAAVDLEATLNSMQVLQAGNNKVSVSRYIHNDPPFSGFAWVITFPVSMGDVDTLVVDDQAVTGANVAVNVYPMLNFTMSAQKPDINGHFTISVGDETTDVLTWDATDGTVLSRLQNLTNVAKVAMIGVRDAESKAMISGLPTKYSSGLTTIRVAGNLAGRISEGDIVTCAAFPQSVLGRYVTGYDTNAEKPLFTRVFLSESTPAGAATNADTTCSFGAVSYGKTALPGRVSISNSIQVISAQMAQSVISTTVRLSAGNIVYISGRPYSVTATVPTYSAPLCVNASGVYCATLSSPYVGPVNVIGSYPLVYAFPSPISLVTTNSWLNLIKTNDKIWIGDDQLTVTSVSSTSVLVSAATAVTVPYNFATAFMWSYGFERSIVFKATNAQSMLSATYLSDNVRNSRVTVESGR